MRNKCFSVAIFHLVLPPKTRAALVARPFLGIQSHRRPKRHCVIYLEVKKGFFFFFKWRKARTQNQGGISACGTPLMLFLFRRRVTSGVHCRYQQWSVAIRAFHAPATRAHRHDLWRLYIVIPNAIWGMCYVSSMQFCPGNLELLQVRRNVTIVARVWFHSILVQFGPLDLQMFMWQVTWDT